MISLFSLLLLAKSENANSEFLDSKSLIIELNDDNFNELTNSHNKNSGMDWLVYFYLPSCYLCDPAEKLIQEVSQIPELNSVMYFGKVNLKESPVLSEKLSIDRAPTICYFTQGTMHAVDYPITSDHLQFSLKTGSYKQGKRSQVPLIQGKRYQLIYILLIILTPSVFLFLYYINLKRKALKSE